MSARNAAVTPATAPEGSGTRIAAARDAVLPYVVSILTVSQNFEQGEPTLSVSSGSGTVITPEGHVVTNAHVVEKGKAFRVVFADGRELPAKLIGEDTLSDLAVLLVQPPKPETFKHAEFASANDLQAGDTVLAMGAPWGLSNSMSAGVVNNPRRLLVSLFDDEADYEDTLGPIFRPAAITRDPARRRDRAGQFRWSAGRRERPHRRRQRAWHGVRRRPRVRDPGSGRQARRRRADRQSAPSRAARLCRISPAFAQGHRFRRRRAAQRGRSRLARGTRGLRAGDLLLTMDGKPVSAPQPIDVPGLQRDIAELPIARRSRSASSATASGWT